MMRIVLLLSCIALGAAPAFGQSETVTFDAGTEGWIGPLGSGGATSIVTTGGNPGANMRTVFNDFGITFFNSTNPSCVGDFTTATSVTIAIDLKVELVRFFGTNVSRPWLVELRDYDGATGGYPWNGVWFRFAQVSAASHGSWTRLTVTFDPNATVLPSGWGGSGSEDPVTYQPRLPPGVTFRDVLRGIDAIAFTTLEPGFVFGFTDHTFRIDNITVARTIVPLAGDVDGNGAIDATDLSLLLEAWGSCPPKGACAADFNEDTLVNAQDMAMLLANWSG